MELTDNDKQRIEQEAIKLAQYMGGVNSTRKLAFIAGAEYEHKYQREQQAKEIEKLKELLRTAEGALRFAGLERTADVIEKALNE